MKPDGNLSNELRELGEYSIKSRKDAQAVCDALKRLDIECEDSFNSPLHALTAMFQNVAGRDCPAFDVFSTTGQTELIRAFKARLKNDMERREASDLLFILKMLALYGSREGAETILEAARLPLKPDDYLWSVILSVFSDEHPQRDWLFDALSDPLPPDFIAVGLLDAANAAAIAGSLSKHPFDSPTGREQIRHWLTDPNPDHFSYAHSATATLPFITGDMREDFFLLAMDHLDAGVRMEAAWAAAKVGRSSGWELLAEFCRQVSHSEMAQQYLTELGRADLIPAEVRDPSFQAKATFAQWLAHPNELGRPPDELEIVDHRMLHWPPERAAQPFWLIRYLARDETGLEPDDVDCGLVGSTTWCFFSYEMNRRPPEDVYAIHCYWEMEHANLIMQADATDPKEYASILTQWRGEPLQSAVVTHVAELSPELNPPSRMVALASAKLNGEEGWVALDDAGGAWYPKAEQPDAHDSGVLKIHVGRQLLGFREQPNRREWLARPQPTIDPVQLITNYEKLVKECEQADVKRQEELLESHGPLERYFGKYVDAMVQAWRRPREEALIEAYEHLIKLADQADSSLEGKVLDVHAVLGAGFDDYIEALIHRDRASEVSPLVRRFEPHWDHNLGYGKLGSAAFKARDWELAEALLLKLRHGLEDYCRSEEMSQLAEIWAHRGQEEQARALLIDCLSKLVPEFQQSEYASDRQMYASRYALHREAFLRLFAGDEASLALAGLPAELS